MRLLLDTNVVLDLALGSDVLRRDVVERLGDGATTLVVSTVVPWEIAIKWRQGKLPIPEPPGVWAPRMVREFGAELLPITLDHAVRVADLPDHHRDPFDRLLIAQAQVEDMAIVTADRSFTAYDVQVIPARRPPRPTIG
jgi:PIN domain nuclease of toxin-antitoxin system